jgi:hypothetical protein
MCKEMLVILVNKVVDPEAQRVADTPHHPTKKPDLG